ncbi:phage tail protein I [Breoghania sp.]|uniref:phage tail protein I n=1 Tax=Breoghania sp. TaxID=2065378 RepID=UPI002AA91943|nr:phage tail protein I [Breoghania sp.]
MSDFESIIPHTSALDLAVEETTSFGNFPDFDLVGSMTDPARIPAKYLPFLAFELGVDLWLDEWDESKKRSVIAKQVRLHRIKGTLAGIREMLALVDAEVVQAIRPPQRAFAGRTITKAQRDAWLAKMPQVRIYLVSETGTKGADGFARGDTPTAPAVAGGYAGAMFARLDRAAAIYGRRATLRLPDGAETSLTRATVETTEAAGVETVSEQVYTRGEAGAALFSGGFASGRFVSEKWPKPQIYTYSLDRSYIDRESALHLDTVSPGLEPVDINYERMSDKGRAGAASFVGLFAGQKYAVEDRGGDMLFDGIRLHDRAIDAPWIAAHTFANHTRLGIRAFHAQMLVKARSHRKKRAGYANRVFFNRAFALKENLQKTNATYAAIRRSKAGRDRIAIDSNTLRDWEWRDGIPLDGSFAFGKRVRNRL